MKNLVYVKFEHSDKPYLFALPLYVTVEQGCKLYVPNARCTDEVVVEVVGTNFLISDTTASILFEQLGVKGKMKFASGKAIQKKYEKLPF